MKSVALVTYSKEPNLFESDLVLENALKVSGLSVYAVPWDDRKIDWKKFDVLILRSCWNYHEKINDFLKWLKKLENDGIKIFNPFSIVRWNYHKKYLLELEKKGVLIIPTMVINQHQKLNIEEVINKGWQEVVIKPAIGASAYKVYKEEVNNKRTLKERVEKIQQTTDVIIQPLIEEIKEKGELSYIYINGEFSHSILKKPKKGEFRSNYKYRGKEALIAPDKNLLEQTKAIINKLNFSTLYARVDGIDLDGKFHLMELELIEPYLYFEFFPNAAIKLATTLKNFLN